MNPPNSVPIDRQLESLAADAQEIADELKGALESHSNSREHNSCVTVSIMIGKIRNLEEQCIATLEAFRSHGIIPA